MSSKSKNSCKTKTRKSHEISERGTMRHMNNMVNNHFNMMNSFFGGGSSFGMLEGPPNMVNPGNDVGVQGNYVLGQRRARHDFLGWRMMPHMGFPDMRGAFQDMVNNGNCHSYSSSTVMTMTNGPDGRPQVYQASSSTREAPGGVKETRKSVADSRTGVNKMQIGHHIGERGHVVEREKNFQSGEAEEREEYINLEEEEADEFNREWQSKIGGRGNAIGYSDRRRHHQSGTQPQLALPYSPHSSSYHSSRGPEMKKKRPHEYDSENSQMYRKKNFKVNNVKYNEPEPVVEEPDSDDDQSQPDSQHKGPSKSNCTTIIELE